MTINAIYFLTELFYMFVAISKQHYVEQGRYLQVAVHYIASSLSHFGHCQIQGQ